MTLIMLMISFVDVSLAVICNVNPLVDTHARTKKNKQQRLSF